MNLESKDPGSTTAMLDPEDLSESFDQAMSPMMHAQAMPREQRQAVAAAHMSPTPTLVWWGPDNEQYANSAALAFMGEEHAACMGSSAQRCWQPAWPTLSPLLDHWAAHASKAPWRVINVPLTTKDNGPRHVDLTITSLSVDARVRGYCVTLKGNASFDPHAHSIPETTSPVLLIDHDPQTRAELADAMSRTDLPILVVSSEESIAHLHTSFSLVIIGPGSVWAAKELITGIRRIDPAVCLPIILVGSMGLEDGFTQTLLSGGDEYLPWPLSDAGLLGTRVESLLAMRYRRETALVRATDRASNLERALDTNRSIGMALGILMVTMKITSEEAFECLKHASQRSNRKLRDIADEVIYTGLLPEDY